MRRLLWLIPLLTGIAVAAVAATDESIPDWGRWTLAGTALAGVVGLGIAVLIGPASRRLAGERHPLTQAERQQMTATERVEAVNAARHTLIQAATGLVVIGGVVFTAQGSLERHPHLPQPEQCRRTWEVRAEGESTQGAERRARMADVKFEESFPDEEWQLTVIETALGPVRGYTAQGVTRFLGIPYAASPAGGKRFMPPELPGPWRTTRDAQTFGPAVPQIAPPGMPLRTAENGCLTVNIWTPAADSRRRPVLVWPLDGAHVLGFPAMVDGRWLAEKHDVVVVSVGIRVGGFGYLWLGDDLGHSYDRSGNLGTLDFEVALAWVRDNIDRFGGDPERVTAFGISGAAGTVLAQLATSSQLIHRAILQSGDQTMYRTTDVAQRTTSLIFDHLGLRWPERRRILSIPAAEILAAQEKVMRTPSRLDSSWFGPVIGPVLERHPLDALRDGAAADVPIIAGSTRDEFTGLIADSPAIRHLPGHAIHRIFETTFPAKGDEALNAYRMFYGFDNDAHLIGALFGDRLFGFGGVRVAEARLAARASTYVYHFRWPPHERGGFRCSARNRLGFHI